MRELYLYPTLNEDNAEDFGIEISDFSFNYQGVSLHTDEKDVLRNPYDNTWTVRKNGVGIKISLRLTNVEKLYGKHGVACSGAKIGFYAVWSNPNTMQSDSGVLKTSDGINFELNRYFQPETIKGLLNVAIHAYVEKPTENVKAGEEFLMNDRGVSIGIVASKSILLDNDNLWFPIFEVAAEDKPLWWVDINWDDPRVERFDNCIAVYINKKFKSYPKNGKDIEFLCTIIASVYFLIIKKLLNSSDEIMSSIYNESEEFEEYSVCSVMGYFCRMLNRLTLDDIINSSDEKLMAELQREINLTYGGGFQ